MRQVTIQLDAMPRMMPVEPKVLRVGHLPEKTRWLTRTSTTLNVSFILQGCGELQYAGRTYPIEAPCVLMQWPGAYIAYGPRPDGAAWEEVFVIYDASELTVFEAWGLHPEDDPVWNIEGEQAVRRLIGELQDNMQRPELEGVPDRIDRICGWLVLESKLCRARPPAGPHDVYLDDLRRYIMNNLGQPHDFRVLAKRYGVSLVSLRRHWSSRYGLPPVRDLTRLRMQEACRLLVDTDKPVKVIATDLGFDDALYFSRCFQKAHGVSATDYRRRFAGEEPGGA